jgi:hypothetical protein
MEASNSAIGQVGKKVKIAAGLFWADYAVLGAQVKELTEAGVDWIHIEVRDGIYMQFGMPRGGLISSKRREPRPIWKLKLSSKCTAQRMSTFGSLLEPGSA